MSAREPLFSEILQALPPEMRAPLLDKIVQVSREIRASAESQAPAAEPRHARIRRRDDVIRRVLAEQYQNLPATCAAHKLAAELADAAIAYRRNPALPANASTLRRRMFEILDANEGSALGWRRIHQIAAT